MVKSKKVETEKIEDKTKSASQNSSKKSISTDEITFQGKIIKNKKIDIPDIYDIKITSEKYEFEIELPNSLIRLIENKFDFTFKENNNITVKISRKELNQDGVMFLGKCIVYEVGKKHFVGSIGGLMMKLGNVSDDIKLFPQNLEVFVGLYKS
ncbi:MAG: hypothetical protein ACTSRG_02055 [Candidatus Helarchaeota archaeon]